jgi:tetratricopeptide (TPR) repeat protein
MADRYLYLSSFGFVFVGLLVISRLWVALANRQKARRLFVFTGSVSLILLALLSFDRCRVWKNALTLWTNAVRTYPNFQFNHYGLGNAYFESGQLEQALAAYKTANLFKENFSATYNIARIYDELGDSAEATRYYSKVLDLYTDDMKNQPEVISRTYERLGMKNRLASFLLERGKLLVSDPRRVGPIARRLFNLGYPDYAIEVLTGAAAHAPPSSGLRTSLAEVLILRGDLEGAERALQAARAAGENPSRLAPLEADLLFDRGDWQRAVLLYESSGVEALSSARKERLAAGYLRSGYHSKALASFRGLAAEAGKPVASAHNNIGVVLEAMDSLEAAENEYLRAVKLEPDYADAWFNLGNLARKQGRFDRALEYYSRTREIEGSSLEVENAIAEVLTKLGR